MSKEALETSGMRAIAWRGVVRIAVCCLIGMSGFAANAFATGTYRRVNGAHYAPTQSKGTVIFRIQQNQQNYLDLAGQGQFVVVCPVEEGQTVAKDCRPLSSYRRGLSFGDWFIATLKPGTYAVRDPGDRPPSLFKRAERIFGKFEVRAGQVTNLGVWARTGSKKFRESKIAPFGDDDPDTAAQAFPELKAYIGKSVLGWVDGSLPTGLDVRRQYALSNAYGLQGASEAVDGTWLFGSRLGIVRSWRPGDTSCTAHDTGVRVSIETTASLPGGKWLVGGENSTLLLSSDHGTTWTSVRGNLPYGLVAKVAAVDDNIWLTLVDEDKVQIYEGTIDSKHWQLKTQARIKPEKAYENFDLQPVQSFVAGKVYATTLPPDHFNLFDMSTGETTAPEAPGHIVRFSMAADGTMFCWCAAFRRAEQYSNDHGLTWTKIADTSGDAPPTMQGDARGVMPMPGRGFALTDDGGSSWTPVSVANIDPPHHSYIAYAYYSADGKRIVATDGVENIWSSEDAGQHWHQEIHLGLPEGDFNFR